MRRARFEGLKIGLDGKSRGGCGPPNKGPGAQTGRHGPLLSGGKHRAAPRKLNLEDFDGEVLGAGANGDHGDEGIGTGTEDGEVGGVLVSDEKHGG